MAARHSESAHDAQLAREASTIGNTSIVMGTPVAPTHDTVVERKQAKLAPPPMYQVVLLNDDYTPMDFVVVVVQHVFGKSLEEAARIMLKVHHEGRGVVGVYTRDIAATRVESVIQLARMNQHPLQCIMEDRKSTRLN